MDIRGDSSDGAFVVARDRTSRAPRQRRRVLLGALALMTVAGSWSFVLAGTPQVQGSTAATATSAARQGSSISGLVVDSDGAPVRKAVVTVGDDATGLRAGEPVACVTIAPTRQASCQGHVATTRTDDEGRWRIDLTRDAALSHTGAGTLRVVRDLRAFTGSFTLGARDGAALAPVQLWTRVAEIAASEGEPGVLEVTQTLPDGADAARRVDLTSLEGQRTATAWPVPFEDDATTATVDAHVVERGSWALLATTAGTWNGRPATWTGSTPLETGEAVPATRGQDCWTYDAQGDQQQAGPCTVTNGRFGDAPDRRAAAGAKEACRPRGYCRRDAVILDLGRISQPVAVVLRTCRSCTVELSLNRELWSTWSDQVRTRDAAGYSIITGGSTSGRFLRVSGPRGLLGRLAEVSVWTAEQPVTIGIGT